MSLKKIVRLAGLILMLALSTSCSATTNTPEPTSTFSSILPSGGVYLADAGISNGPAGFSVPQGLEVNSVIDQSNVVTLVMDSENGELLENYLNENLESMGFEITGQSEGSIVFTGDGWEGAFTTGNNIAGLTLRDNPGTFSTPS